MDKDERRKKRLAESLTKEFGDDVDYEAELDSSLTSGENRERLATDFGLKKESTPTHKEVKSGEKQAYRSNVEYATGQTFVSDFGGEQKIDALPRLIKRKNIEIRIDAPILSDSEAIKNAISIGLSRMAEAIVKSVTTNEGGEFGDSKPEGFGDRGNIKGSYSSPAAYYSSGKIPFWHGGLRGSFEYVGAMDRLNHTLMFTASYAQGIEEGGMSGALPVEWSLDKNFDIYTVSSTHRHPFTGAVAEKIYNNLEGFGYLNIFGTHFVASIRG